MYIFLTLAFTLLDPSLYSYLTVTVIVCLYRYKVPNKVTEITKSYSRETDCL